MSQMLHVAHCYRAARVSLQHDRYLFFRCSKSREGSCEGFAEGAWVDIGVGFGEGSGVGKSGGVGVGLAWAAMWVLELGAAKT